MSKNTGYEFSRQWFDFCFENPSKTNTNHTALYMWLIELNNRLGWVKEFSAPSQYCMDAIGIKSYKTYRKTFKELETFGFIKVIQESKNQHTACIVALVKITEAPTNALTNAVLRHLPKHLPTHSLHNKTIKPLNNKQETEFFDLRSLDEVKIGLKEQQYQDKEAIMKTYKMSEDEYNQAVDMFCLDEKNTQDDFSKVVSHFKNYVKNNVKTIRLTAEAESKSPPKKELTEDDRW